MDTEIATWLASDQPYAPGVALYARVGTSKAFQRLFAQKPTDYSRQVLARELRAVLGEVASTQAEASPAPVPLPAAPVEVLTGTAVAVLAQVRRELRAVRDERSHIHPHLTAPRAGKKARYAAASRILELTAQEVKLKDREAHVLAHGRLPGPVPAADVCDAGELRQRLGNLLSRRSKLRKCPERAADLAAVEADILLIRSKLIPSPQ